MKKVLSVAMASAMVLGMGANAFAIKYNTDSNDTAKWPTDFKFDGKLFVTDKDNKIVTDATTRINHEEKVNFQAGDVIWMPLYADGQIVYGSKLDAAVPGLEAGKDVQVTPVVTVAVTSGWKVAYDAAKNLYYLPGTTTVYDVAKDLATNAGSAIYALGTNDANGLPEYGLRTATLTSYTLPTRFATRAADVIAKSERFFIGAKEVSSDAFLREAAKNNGTTNLLMTVDIKGVDGKAPVIGDAYDQNLPLADDYHYTGNIDKNWSVNLLEEKGTTLTDVVEKAELYKATEKDYHSYKEYTDEIVPNGVYVRVHLKDDWKFCNTLDMKYYVYVADNAGKQTNKVWVSGKYEAAAAKTVDFTWSNDASKAGLWKANENGVAVFDFADKAFFTVKMYKDECLYLDLDAAYKTATAKDFDSEIDSFYYFDTENANFIREGELVIVSDNADLAVYEIAEDEIFDMEAEYVTNYAVAHTNEKINGYKFNTAELGKYVLADEIVVEDEEEAKEEEKPAEEVKPSEDAKEETVKPNKVNPNTGANDFVGLAVSLAVVSVAAAGALALKK